MKQIDLLIKNGIVLTMDPKGRTIEKGAVFVDKGKIVGVGSSREEENYTAQKVVDAKGGIIMPGMVNAHTHVSMTLFRSLADDTPDRLSRYIFPLEKRVLSPEMVYTGAIHGIFEMIRGGVTCFADMYLFEDQVAKAARELGIRAVVGENIIKFPVADAETPERAVEYAEALAEKYRENELITAAVAPHAPHTNSSKILEAANRVSEKFNIPLLMHVAETEEEVAFFRENYNQTAVEYLEERGLLTERVTAAHSIFVTDSDIELLKKRDVGISHNMVANIKSAKGVAPVLKMEERAVRVGLGTDGAMSGNTLDIITQMGYVAKVHKLIEKDRSVMVPEAVVRMATIGGARALHMEERVGTLEVGKLADITVVGVDSLNMTPLYNPYSALVYSATPKDVTATIVNGKVLFQDGRFSVGDLEKSRERVLEISQKIAQVAKTL